MNEPIIGIDFGTTNSEVAVLVDGRIELVEENGSPIMPSYVGLDPEGKLLIGLHARNQYVLYPERTIRSIKRKMGSDERVTLGDKEYSPQEITAMILHKLKERAESRLGCPVQKAVITVPAQFSDAQRQATRDAGTIAGLEVVRIINEPTAACLAYEGGSVEGGKSILAFDLGGGTFDVSIVRMEGDVVEVVSSHGNNHLGGDDMDDLIADWITERVFETQETPALLTPLSQYRLKRVAETAKMHLTDNPHAKIIENNLETTQQTRESIHAELSRTEFDDMVRPLTDRMVLEVHKALADAGLRPAQIDEIILVGGATRIPAVQDILEQKLGKRPCQSVHPDLAVAYGAGVMAARLMDNSEHRVLIDITPYTFGTSVVGWLNDEPTKHKFVPVIRAGAPLPVTKADSFFTLVDNQVKVNIHIFQGEHTDARENILVGRFMVTGLAQVPAGNELILNMQLDLDGILRVTAIEKQTGLNKAIKIEDALAKLSEEDIARSKQDIRRLFGEEDGEAEDLPDDETPEVPRSGYEDKVKELSTRIAARRDMMDAVDKEDAENLLAKLDDALRRGEESELERLITELEDLLFYVEVE